MHAEMAGAALRVERREGADAERLARRRRNPLCL